MDWHVLYLTYVNLIICIPLCYFFVLAAVAVGVAVVWMVDRSLLLARS